METNSDEKAFTAEAEMSDREKLFGALVLTATALMPFAYRAAREFINRMGQPEVPAAELLDVSGQS